MEELFKFQKQIVGLIDSWNALLHAIDGDELRGKRVEVTSRMKVTGNAGKGRVHVVFKDLPTGSNSFILPAAALKPVADE